MKRAAYSDQWRRAETRRRATAISRFSIRASDGIQTTEITINPFLTAFFGSNGVGKSIIVHALLTAAGQEHLVSPALNRLSASELELEFQVDGAVKRRMTSINKDGTVVVSEGSDEIPIPVVFVDAATDVKAMQRLIAEDVLVPDGTEGEAIRELNAKQRELLCRLARKDYDRVVVTEVETAEEGHADTARIWPHFEVQESGRTYGSREMGLGELALHFIVWQLELIDYQALIVIDEPDVFLAPFSQTALLDHLADVCTRNGSQVIMSTHSSTLLARVPPQSVNQIFRHAGKSCIVKDSSKGLSRSALGIRANHEIIMFCEDERAVILANALLVHGKCPVLYSMTSRVCDGESRVEALMEHLPSFEELCFIGCFDGDQRGKLKPAVYHPKVVLPSRVNPEQFAKKILSGNTELASARLSVSNEEFKSALDAVRGEDPHDWMGMLATILGREDRELMKIAAEIAPVENSEHFTNAIVLAVQLVSETRRGGAELEDFLRGNLETLLQLREMGWLVLPSPLMPMLDQLKPASNVESSATADLC